MDNKINEEKYYDICLLLESIKLTTGLEIDELISFFNKVDIKNNGINRIKKYINHLLYILSNLNKDDDYIKKIMLFYGIKIENGSYKILGYFLNKIVYDITNSFHFCKEANYKENKIYLKEKTS